MWGCGSQSYSQCESNDTENKLLHTAAIWFIYQYTHQYHLTRIIQKALKSDEFKYSRESFQNIPKFMGQISSTDIEIIVREELHISLFTMQKLVYWSAPSPAPLT